jgi:formylglycine-generating enzyme required for sulfatase activity
VETVSWFDAVAFCNALSEKDGVKPYYQIVGSGADHRVSIPDLDGTGFRLPTEAEWEYVCRAGTTTNYSFGNDPAALQDVAWFDGNSEKKTHPVAEKQANKFHLHDMYGNVREWCWDRYDKDYYKKKDPKDSGGPGDPADNHPHVQRGGSWDSAPPLLRSAARAKIPPIATGQFFGFRVVRNAQ